MARHLLQLAVMAVGIAGFPILSPAKADGDPAYGEYLAGQCTACHQKSGKDKGIPSIVGWHPEAFVIVMNAYKTKEREHKAMQTIASSLGDEEIAALAAYFAQLKPQD
ncbi:MAG: c-type cytochrome [Pseudomonadota bacterium]